MSGHISRDPNGMPILGGVPGASMPSPVEVLTHLVAQQAQMLQALLEVTHNASMLYQHFNRDTNFQWVVDTVDPDPENLENHMNEMSKQRFVVHSIHPRPDGHLTVMGFREIDPSSLWPEDDQADEDTQDASPGA